MILPFAQLEIYRLRKKWHFARIACVETVIFIKAIDRHPDRRKLDGVREAAGHLGWRVQVSAPVSSTAEVAELEKFWDPVGYIVASGISKGSMPVTLFGKKPVVYFNLPDEQLYPASRCVHDDADAVARLAAKELLSLGLPRYGYVCDPGRPAWSEPRREAFARALALHGRHAEIFDPTECGWDNAAFTTSFAAWLRSGPLPMGIFAVTDATASHVASACTAAGLRLPDDIALIGVSNEESLCEGQAVTLSSIAMNYAAGGRLAVEKLARLAAGCEDAGPAVYSPLWVVRRASTTRLGRTDEAVTRALERIRREACGGLAARDVLKGFECSRRSAETRFRAAVGRSILEEIRRVRLEASKRLLVEGHTTIDAIAFQCGYASSAAFSTFFRAETGTTPTKWRNSAQTAQPAGLMPVEKLKG